MTDLEDIAAEAHIAIVESVSPDGGDSLINTQDTITPSSSYTGSQPTNAGKDPNIDDLNAMFSYRFTDEDLEYVNTVEMAETLLRPPCVENFFVRRQRDNSRGNHRGGGDSRGFYHHHGGGDRGRHWQNDFRDNRKRNHAGWGGGDHRNRDYTSERDYHYNRESRDIHRSRDRQTDRSPHR